MSIQGEYRYAASYRWGAFLTVVVGMALWGSFLSVVFRAEASPVTPERLILLSVAPLALTAYGLYLVNRTWGVIAVDALGIEVRGLVGSNRREFSEFDRLEPVRGKQEGFILWPLEGTPLQVVTTGLTEAAELCDYAKSRIVSGSIQDAAVSEYGNRYPKYIVVYYLIAGAAFVVFPWLSFGTRASSLLPAVVFNLFTIAIVLLVIDLTTTQAQVFSDRVVKRSAVRSQTVRFTEVKEIELGIAVGKQETVETITLTGSGRDLTFTGQLHGFSRLRDTLLDRCKHATVQDRRGSSS